MEHVAAIIAKAMQARREDRLDAALEILRTAPEPHPAEVLAARGQIERDLGNYDVALDYYQSASELYLATGNKLRYAHAVRHIADIHQDRGDLASAEPHYVEALKIYRSEATSAGELANALRGYALLKNDRALWEETRDLYMGAGIEAGVAECDRRLSSFAEPT